jgi:hydantoinase/carbamoylase family amidase
MLRAPLQDARAMPHRLPPPACAAQILDWADALAVHTEEPGALTCTYLSPAHCAVAAQLAQWMREAGFDSVRTDAIGNVVGRYRADPAVSDPELVVAGSHYDTVRNGGRYDGRLGILVPLALVQALHAAGRRLPFDLELVAFSEEEGVRFGSTFLGSSAYAGHFSAALLDVTDGQGVSLAQAMSAAGLRINDLPAAAVSPQRLRHYLEVHIEQGPVLLAHDLPLGVVTAIAGGVRRRLTLTGTASHAGTTPMSMRRDAACAAAEIVLAVEQRCSGVDGLVGTVGQLEVPGGSINVVPGACQLSLDVRAGDDAVRDAALADIMATLDSVAARRGITVHVEELLRAPAVPCDAQGRQYWAEAVQEAGVPALSLPSGAGHDAMMMARIVPVSMLFVRCGNGGISHNPLEIVSRDDVQKAVDASWAFLARLAAEAR